MANNWPELIESPTRYLSRRRLLADIPKWQIQICRGQIKQIHETIRILIQAYECLIVSLDNEWRPYRKFQFSPSPCRTFTHVIPERELSIHVQLLHSKLVHVILLKKQLELRREYTMIVKLVKECSQASIFKRVDLSDGEIESTMQLVQEWLDTSVGGKMASARALIEEANNYSVFEDSSLLS